MASKHMYAFIAVSPETGEMKVHAGYLKKSDAESDRLNIFDSGLDVGGVKRIVLSLPHGRGGYGMHHGRDD